MVLLCLSCGPALAQEPVDPEEPSDTDSLMLLSGGDGRPAWEDYDKRLAPSRAVAPLGPDLLGDAVSLQNGALSFEATDVSVPGNNALPVAFTRRYEVMNHKDYGSVSDGMLGDWNVVVPSISGSFASNWESNGTPGNRCSDRQPPPLPDPDVTWTDFWHGLQIELPGSAGELLAYDPAVNPDTPVPSDGATYRWVTNDHVRVSCLASIDNHTGQGFLAVTPEGTKYWFEHMAQYFEPTLESVLLTAHGSYTKFHARRKNVLYATRVEDRFGNWVTYTYTNAWNTPGKLTAIQSSDGRQLTIGYTGSRITSVSDGSRTWSYAYGTTPAEGRATLTQVTLPDASKWTIDLDQFTDAEVQQTEPEVMVSGEIYRTCKAPEIPLNVSHQPIGAITHPSGATGTFTLGIALHGRSNVPLSCGNVGNGDENYLGGNNPNDDINLFTLKYYALTLLQKQLSGPGMATASWQYAYSPNTSWFYAGDATNQQPTCTSGAACYEPDPVCAPACPGASLTTVTGPGSEWVRYTYGNSFRYNEGKLLRVDRGSSETNILQSVVNDYDFTQTDQQYPASYGTSLKVSYDGFASQWHRPLIQADTILQGETFTWEAMEDCTGGDWCLDVYAHPTRVRRHSTQGTSRTETTAYWSDPARWIIGRVASVTCNPSVPASTACDGDVAELTTFDALGRPLTRTAFGKLQHTLTYHADGTLHTYRDGNDNVTTLSSWYRGVPRLIQYPGSVSESATVDATGTIASTTDENGFTTSYAYDAVGRLTGVTYPTGDSTTWNAMSVSYDRPAVAEHGIAAGHWRQLVSQGDYRKYTWFDGLMRPVVTQEYDNTDANETRRFTRKAYDHAGRVTFASYPSTSSGATPGVTTVYDALGRVVSVSQSSELGPLVTATAYLSGTAGYYTRVTNPRGFQTRTWYQAFDAPGYDVPELINHPEGASTSIERDPYGKPTAITRSGAGVTPLTRSYAYNTYQELCRQDEPETKATLMGYDGAGNLAWSASGLANLTACDIEGDTPAILARKAARTYDTRNRPTALSFPDGQGDTLTSYTPDGLPASITAYNGADVVTTAYAYNKRRMLVQERLQWNSIDWPIGYSYDGNGHLAQLDIRDLAVPYAPNALGQPQQAGSYASAVDYYPNGALKQFTYGNGVVHTMIQNARGLPERSYDALGATEILEDWIDYDANGNVAAITDARTGGNQRGNRTMAYDGLDRLTQAVSPLWNGTASYAYDALDNLTRVTVPATALAPARDHHYCYAATNRLTNVKTGSCTGATVIGIGYDGQGNVVNRNGATYAFDFGNRLRQSVDGGTVDYVYDGLGRRVRDAAAGGAKYGLYARGGQLLFGQDNRKGEQHWHVYLAGSLIATRKRVIATGAVSTQYQHTDALGSPVAVTDSTGSVLYRSEYEPYGRMINRANDDLPGYAGHVMDAGTDLTYMQQRYYDPGIGMFLSTDPVTAYSNPIGQFNRYRYANNNTYKFTDPDGRQSESAMDRRYVYSRLSREQVAGLEAQHDGIGAQAAAGLAAGAMEVVGAKGIGLIARGIAAFRAMRAANGAAKTITRYMGRGEANKAKADGAIPNVGPDSIARPTHVTADKPVESSAQAMRRYELGEPPTHSATVPADRVSDLGKAPDGRWTTSGNGGQNATNQPIRVTREEIKELKP